MTGTYTGRNRVGARRGFAGALLLVFVLAAGPRPAVADPLAVRGLMDRVHTTQNVATIERDAVLSANREVVEGLVALGAGAALDMTPYLLDARPEVRHVAIEALALLGAKSAVDPLVELLDHTDDGTAVAAAGALGRIKGEAAGSALRTLIRRRSPEPARPPVRRAAVRALPGTDEPTQLLPFLLPLLDQYPDPEDAAATVAALAGVGDPSALDAIAPLLEDPKRRTAVLLELGELGVHAVPLLEQELATRGGDVQALQDVADSALRLGAPGLAVIERILRSSPSRDLDLHILRGLRAVPERGSVDLVLRRYLTHRDSAYVVAAVEQLGEDRDSEALAGLHRLLEHGDRDVRKAAAHAIGEVAASASVNPLTFALTREAARRDAEANVDLRCEIIWALGQIRNEGAVPVLIGALDVPDQRDAAVQALVLAGRPAIRTLVLIIKSGDVDREPLAIETILKIGDAAGRDVVGLLEHPARQARMIGLELTAAVGDVTAVPVLTKMALDATNPNRLDALRVLSVFYTPDLRPVFQRIVREGDLKLKKSALQALWRHEDHEAGKYLLGVAEDAAEPEIRVAAVYGAFFMGVPGSQDLFQRMVEYEKATVRSAATEALSYLGDPRVVPLLAKAIPDAPPEYQAELRQSLMRLVRYQGDSTRPPDFMDWYGDHSGDFPDRKSAVEGAGDPEDTSRGVVSLPSGGRLAYRVTGDEDDPLVIALHDGPDGDSALLRQGLADLDDDFRFVTYDRRGRGRSRVEGGAEAWEDYSLVREASDLDALRRHFGKARMSIVAHGFGANVAIRYAATYGDHVDRIVLLNAPYPVAEAVADRSTSIRARLSGPAEKAVAWLEGRRGYFPRTVYNERWAYYVFPAFFHRPEQADRYAPPGFDVELNEAALQTMTTFNLEDSMVTIRRPVLVLLGTNDLYPAEIQARWQRLVSLVPGGAKLRTMEEAGHFLFLERKGDTVDQVRDFLEGDD